MGVHRGDGLRVDRGALRIGRTADLVPSPGGSALAPRALTPAVEGGGSPASPRAGRQAPARARAPGKPPAWKAPIPWPDLLLAAGVALATMVGLLDRGVAGARLDDAGVVLARPDVLAEVLVLGMAVPIVWRTRHPWPAAAVTCLASILFWGRGYEPQPIPYGPLVLVFTLAEREPAKRSLLATSAFLLAVVGEYSLWPRVLSDDLLIAYALSIGASWTLGYGVKTNRERAALLEAQAALIARQSAAVADLAVERERARIARDLHDVVSHHVSVIVAQAAAAQRLPPGDPVGGARTLKSIENTGREAMVQMRRMLGVLHPAPEPDPPGGDGLDRLPELLATTRGAGLPVELVVDGSARPLPVDVDAEAYTIVREALTNALKHAAGARTQVLLAYRDDGVELRVRDDGSGTSGRSGSGRGLAGVLQRVTLLGGSFAAGRVPGGGFEVVADLPVTRWPDRGGRWTA